jgi:hypothetical protein
MHKLPRSFLALFFSLLISTAVFGQQQALLLYGGKDHDKFLGCLNCGRYDSSSIWNAYGTYGSPYNSDSIWNRYGTWGSPYNSESPWNKYSSSAPVIVDKEGKFYGYFSANPYHDKRTKIGGLVWVLDNYDYVIEHLDEVRDKVN